MKIKPILRQHEKNLIILAFLISLFFLSCQSVYELRLEKPVVMPFKYYHVAPESSQEIKRAKPLPWYKKKDHIIWDKSTLKLYTDHSILLGSVSLIRKNQVKRAAKILEGALKENQSSKKLLGKINNNLAIACLLHNPSQIKKAKFYIDQAGILLSSPQVVMNNVRVITYFFQKDISIIKTK